MTDNPEGAPKAKKYNPKESHRPRRKKARHACSACQKAHLICGDERPCESCIKRDRADTCQNGPRKKAKCLQDATLGASRQVLRLSYDHTTVRSRPEAQCHNSIQPESTIQTTPSTGYYTQGGNHYDPGFTPTSQVLVNLPDSLSFQVQPSPFSPQLQTAGINPSLVDVMLPRASMWCNVRFGLSDPRLYFSGLEGLGFDSQSAGYDFGIPNEMWLGADAGPPGNSTSHTPTTESNNWSNFSNNVSAPSLYGTGSKDLAGAGYAWTEQENTHAYSQNHDLPHACAIVGGLTSPSSPSGMGRECWEDK